MNISMTKKILSVLITVIISLTFTMPTFASTLPTTTRLAGLTKYDTAVAIAKDGWQQSDYAVLAYGENYPDALAAAPLAKKLNAPILLTESASLNNETKQALLDLKVKGVTIVGGTAVVSNHIRDELAQMGIGGSRYAGYDLYDTAAIIAQELNVEKNTPVVIASGEDFPDALSISSIASSKGWPILLVGKNYLAEMIKDYLKNQQPSQVYIVGGTGVISEDIKSQVQSLAPNALITRLAGQDRFDTNALVNQTFAQSPKNIYMATGSGFADALAGSVLAARTGDPIVLVDSKSSTLPSNIDIYLSTIASLRKTVQVTSFGGSAVVPQSQMNSANIILNNANGNTILPTGVSLNKSITTIDVGANETLTGTIAPDNATNKNVTWKSSNTGVATVDTNGKVVGVSAGTTVITVTTVDGSKTASCTVNVGSPNLELNKPYKAQDGLTVTMNSIVKTEEVGSVRYTISYSLKNESTDQKIDESTFRMHFIDGSYLNQYGFFDSLFPAQSINRTYTFEVLKSQIPTLIEYDADFFSTIPENGTLKWKVIPVTESL